MTPTTKPKREKRDLDRNGLPTRTGIYLIEENPISPGRPAEIDVYTYKMKGLCCYSEDFGSGGTGVDDAHDCHVSVQRTGLRFIRRLGDLK